MVKGLAALGRPFDELHRSIYRDAFLVSGDQERDRALRPASACAEVIEDGGERAGDRPFHVDGAAAVERAIGDFAGKGWMGPFRLLAGRHHVDVAGESEVRACRADPGIKVFDRRGAGLGKGDAMDRKACPFQRAFDEAERTGFRRRHRRAAQEVAGERGGIGECRAHRAALPGDVRWRQRDLAGARPMPVCPTDQGHIGWVLASRAARGVSGAGGN